MPRLMKVLEPEGFGVSIQEGVIQIKKGQIHYVLLQMFGLKWMKLYSSVTVASSQSSLLLSDLLSKVLQNNLRIIVSIKLFTHS